MTRSSLFPDRMKPGAACLFLVILLGCFLVQPLSGAGAEESLERLGLDLTNQDPAVRASAAKKLGLLGPGSAPAISALVQALGDKVRLVHLEAGLALSRIGPAAVSDLMKALADENKGIRSGAALALGKIEPPPLEAVPGLINLLTDEDPEVVKNAAYSLRRIGPPAAPELKKAAASGNPGLAKAASNILKKLEAGGRF
ncbi:MAG: HEAT repeat domain-containing protein [Pseudomonadota bacterium]